MNKKIILSSLYLLLFIVIQARETVQDTIKNYSLDEIIIQSPKFNRNILKYRLRLYGTGADD
jgi:iron complex outermembrane recepter protein